MKFITLLGFLFTLTIFSNPTVAQDKSDIEQIRETLTDYIEGTSQGQPERLHRAFHPDFNLYSVTRDDSLRIWDGQDYISGFEPGRTNSRQGRIVSIDHENNAAMAKVEIVIPGRGIYTDYFLLLKLQDEWKIIHKSYTSRPIPGSEH